MKNLFYTVTSMALLFVSNCVGGAIKSRLNEEQKRYVHAGLSDADLRALIQRQKQEDPINMEERLDPNHLEKVVVLSGGNQAVHISTIQKLRDHRDPFTRELLSQELLRYVEEVRRTEQLISAIMRKGSQREIDALLASKVLVTVPNNEGMDALHAAAFMGSLQTFNKILKYAQPGDINVQDNDGFTPWHCAVAREDVKIIRRLRRARADETISNNEGYVADSHSFGEKLLRFNNYNKSSEDDRLKKAVFIGYAAGVRSLIRTKAVDVNKFPFGPLNAFRCAVFMGNKKMIRLLVELGANVNAIDEGSKTFLHRVMDSFEDRMRCEERIKCSKRDLVKLLLELGADVNATDYSGRTPLHLAHGISFSDLELVNLLVERGADVNAIDTYGRTPLHASTRFTNLELVNLLLELGADVNATDTSGRTPLHNAMYLNSNRYYQLGDDELEVVKLLVERGADINAADISGKTPLHVAIINLNKISRSLGFKKVIFSWYIPDYAALVKLLLELGANQDGAENDALRLAAEYDQEKIMQILLEGGAMIKNGWVEALSEKRKKARFVEHARAILSQRAKTIRVHLDGCTTIGNFCTDLQGILTQFTGEPITENQVRDVMKHIPVQAAPSKMLCDNGLMVQWLTWIGLGCFIKTQTYDL